MFSIQSVLVKTDVTAVKLLPKYILSGVGNFLLIFHRDSRNLIAKIQVFNGHKVHGIVLNHDHSKLLVYGENNLKLFKIENDPILTELKSAKINDWILAAKILNDNSIVLVQMNNTVQLYNEQLIATKSIPCPDKCILYSAFIHTQQDESIIIFSGTVFSEILVWKLSIDSSNSSQLLAKLEGHKGVIFSLCFNEDANILCSTSDDRSAIVWWIKQWQDPIEIVRKCQVHGHQSRIFRCHVLSDSFLTGGEDSAVFFWTFNGDQIRSVKINQGASVWSLEADSKEVVVGTSDGGVNLFPLRTRLENREFQLENKECIPRKLGVLKEGTVAITENGTIFLQTNSNLNWQKVCQNMNLRSYCLLRVSKCRNLISFSGRQGLVFIYQIKNKTMELLVQNQCEKSRIYSFHWLSCRLFLICGEEGRLSLWFLNDSSLQLVSKFSLPRSRERWTTSAHLCGNGHLVVGDRIGNLFIFKLDLTEPVQTIKGVHSHLGVTEICEFRQNIVTLGRDSLMKTFSFNDENLLVLQTVDKIPFTWLLSLNDNGLLYAFSSDNFVIWDYDSRRTLIEIPCGGGHRSWDCSLTNHKLSLFYIKDKVIANVKSDFDNFMVTNLQANYHVNEINAVQTVMDSKGNWFLISGGEDTLLRMSTIDNEFSFKPVQNLKSHLSSIRTLISFPQGRNQYLIFSGGGRAQIICWQLIIGHENFVVCNQKSSFYQELNMEESETRIMDLNACLIQNNLMLLAACSDGNIKMFKVDETDNYKLIFIRSLFAKLKCVQKLCTIKVCSFDILLSMDIDGFINFWNISNVETSNSLVPFKTIKIHQSGINSYSYKLFDKSLIIVSGGDDNAIELRQFKFVEINDGLEVEEIARFSDVGTHCALISGTFISDKYFFTCSVDQKLVIFEWVLRNSKFECKIVGQHQSVITDLKGMNCFNVGDAFIVLLYGNGIELVKCVKNQIV